MSNIFVVMGKSASGKDTIFRELAKDDSLQLKTVVSYTTRPIRHGERNGTEYFFVTTEQLQKLEQDNRIIECRAYDTIYGVWYYFTVNDEQIDLVQNNYIMIGTLESFEQIQNYYGKDIVKPIYIQVETGERLQRALDREKQQDQPKYDELCRRFLADEKDFSEDKIAALGIKKTYENRSLEQCMNEIKKEIQKMTQESYKK